MKIEKYNREDAISYAEKYAFSYNPAYYDFSKLGGDCTNFCSQCLYAGSKRMNYDKTFGWYYLSSQNRAPAWAGVNQFYKFLTANIVINKIGEGYGPFGEITNMRNLESGDFIFLGNAPDVFYHTLIVVEFDGNVPLVASHTLNAYAKPLSDYSYVRAVGVKILGVRK